MLHFVQHWKQQKKKRKNNNNYSKKQDDNYIKSRKGQAERHPKQPPQLQIIK